MPRTKAPSRTNNEVRQILLEYFYARNERATSALGKAGVAAKISTIKKELKASHGLSAQEVWSNLTYLISQGWVEPVSVEKTFPLQSGTMIPRTTLYYQITAAGIDMIEVTCPR